MALKGSLGWGSSFLSELREINFTGRLKTYVLQELKTQYYKNICLVANIPSKEMKALASAPSKATNYCNTQK